MLTTIKPSCFIGLKTSRIPLKKAAVEQGSVYVPHAVTALPSPQSAPVHPFHMVNMCFMT